MIDPTTILAELAAIQRDVRTLHDALSMIDLANHAPLAGSVMRAESIAESAMARLASLMSSIAAPPPVDNGMLAPIRARLDKLENTVADARLCDLETEVAAIKSRLDRQHDRICAIEGKGGHG